MSRPWDGGQPTASDRARYVDATRAPFWLDAVRRHDSQPALETSVECDLCIVGGGYTGLWAALQAKADEPQRSIVLLEAKTIGFGASGRNGGFLSSSLTHGLRNGLTHFPEEMAVLERLGQDNFNDLREDLERLRIDCDFEPNGTMAVALEPHELEELEAESGLLRRFGHQVELLDLEAVRGEVASPTYLGGLWDRTGSALVDPGKLAAGLAEAALAAGVSILEHSGTIGLRRRGGGVVVETAHGSVKARRVLLATSAYPPLLHRLRNYIAPVYDYALMTEPLSEDQVRAVGWRNRQGLDDLGNQFHYYRLSADNRILFGGYDAIYHYGGSIKDEFDTRDETFAKLSRHFRITFPQLEGVDSVTVGVERSTPAVVFSCSSEPPSTGRCPTLSATPGWGSGQLASAQRWRSTFWTGGRPRRRDSGLSSSVRCRSHPSH